MAAKSVAGEIKRIRDMLLGELQSAYEYASEELNMSDWLSATEYSNCRSALEGTYSELREYLKSEPVKIWNECLKAAREAIKDYEINLKDVTNEHIEEVARCLLWCDLVREFGYDLQNYGVWIKDNCTVSELVYEPLYNLLSEIEKEVESKKKKRVK